MRGRGRCPVRRVRAMPIVTSTAGVVFSIAALCTLALSADERSSSGDADLQFQLAQPAVRREPAPGGAAGVRPRDPDRRPRPGHCRHARARFVRRSSVAEFGLARQEAEKLVASAGADAEAQTLLGDALWSNGLFDEADRAYERALDQRRPTVPRARFGWPSRWRRSSKLQEALDEALAASAAAPRDGDIHAAIGDIYERLNRYDEAAIAYTNYINLLPNKDRSDKAAWARAQVEFLEAFTGLTPVEIDQEDLHDAAHAAVPAGEGQDRGAGPGERRPPPGLHARHRLRGDGAVARDRTARARPADDLHVQRRRRRSGAARAAAGARRSRSTSARCRCATCRCSSRTRRSRGIPKREGESFSPLSLGMSMMIDYQRQAADDRPQAAADERADDHAADARVAPGDGARRAQLELSGLLRGGHRRRGDLDQLRHRRARCRPTASGAFR